jgi:hypothetical protein
MNIRPLSEPSREVRWVQSWTDARGGTFRIGRVGGDLVAEWDGVARLWTDRAGTDVHLELAIAPDSAHAAKLRLGVVAALLRHLKGGVTVHASAVEFEKTGLAFIGESGSGKSTLAAELCEREGCALLADDAAVVAFPGEPGHGGGDFLEVLPTERLTWLTAESCAAFGHPQPPGGKLPVEPRRIATRGVPLRAIVKLSFQDSALGCCLDRLHGSAVFELLSRSLYRFVLDEPAVSLRDFARVHEVATGVPVYELRRPRELGALGRSRKFLLDILRGQIPENVGRTDIVSG